MSQTLKSAYVGCCLYTLASFGAGCGDALVDKTYLGMPLMTLRGSVTGLSDLTDGDHVRIAVFWSPRGPQVSDLEQFIEQPTSSAEAQLPFSYELNLFDPPDAEHFYTSPQGARYAIGTLVAYADYDHNQRRSSDEPIIGAGSAIGPGSMAMMAPPMPMGMPKFRGRTGAELGGLLYAPTALSAELSPTGLALSAGYHLVRMPLSCVPQPPLPPPAPGGGIACGVPLGASCSDDSQCGGGHCVRTFLYPWPQGACVIPDPPPAGCPPIGAVLVGDISTMPPTTYWLQGCGTDADCGRPAPYQCEASVNVCLPTALMNVSVNDTTTTFKFCP